MEDKSKESANETGIEKPKALANLIYQSKDINEVKPNIKAQLEGIISKSGLTNEYEIIFLYDPNHGIRNLTADQIYKSITKDKHKDILLILLSDGGEIEPAYLISKCCKEYAKRFVVAIPRRAKSAATLLALGADEIHMGQMSQLGPIDPQIGGLPALGLGNAVEYLASLCKRYPDSSEMLAKYLSYKLDLNRLGYFERVSESAAQYAQRLLENKSLAEGQTAISVAFALVYSYKDHNFVIDKNEAAKYFGNSIIKVNTKEYNLSDEIHNFWEEVQIFSKVFKQKDFSIVGNLENGIAFFDAT